MADLSAERLDVTMVQHKMDNSMNIILKGLNSILKRNPDGVLSYWEYRQQMHRTLFLYQIGNEIFLFDPKLEVTFVYTLKEYPHPFKAVMTDADFRQLKASPNGKYVLRRTG